MTTVHDIALLLEGEVVGDGTLAVTGVAKIEEAGPGSLTFIANPKYERFLGTTKATCVLVGRDIDLSKQTALPPAVIWLDDPYSSFVVAIERFMPKKRGLDPGIHPAASVHPGAVLGPGASVGAYAVIGDGTVIGANAVIHPHVVIGRDVRIGDDVLLYPHVVIREECVLGHRVVVQPGAVIGADGFGFAPKKDGTFRKIPQIGIVVIEDDVEIQANACVDRATLGDTHIHRGVKLDNMVQVGHNASVGPHTVIAGSTAVAGSTKIGPHNMIGGCVAISGHLTTPPGLKVAGASLLSRSFTEEGLSVAGFPAKEAGRWRRMEAAARQLPELLTEFRELQKAVAALQEEINRTK